MLIEDIAAIPAVVFSICKGEGGSATHTNIGVCPLGRGAAIEHACGELNLGRECETFLLQAFVDFVDVGQVVSALCGTRPGLDEIEDLLFDVFVDSSDAVGFEEGDEIVEELARGDFGQEVGAAVLDAGIGEFQGGQLDIGILVAYPLLQRSHGIFRLHCFGTDEIGDFERGGNILEAGGSCLFDLLIESSSAGSEPARHVEKATAGIVKLGADGEGGDGSEDSLSG